MEHGASPHTRPPGRCCCAAPGRASSPTCARRDQSPLAATHVMETPSADRSAQRADGRRRRRAVRPPLRTRPPHGLQRHQPASRGHGPQPPQPRLSLSSRSLSAPLALASARAAVVRAPSHVATDGGAASKRASDRASKQARREREDAADHPPTDHGNRGAAPRPAAASAGEPPTPGGAARTPPEPHPRAHRAEQTSAGGRIADSFNQRFRPIARGAPARQAPIPRASLDSRVARRRERCCRWPTRGSSTTRSRDGRRRSVRRAAAQQRRTLQADPTKPGVATIGAGSDCSHARTALPRARAQWRQRLS